MTGWPLELYCQRCHTAAVEGCERAGHPVGLTYLLDSVWMWREHDEEVQARHEFDARRLGEAA